MKHYDWDDDPVELARSAAFQRAAAGHRRGYRWLNARGTHWIEPVSEEEFQAQRLHGRLRSLCCASCGGLFVGEFTPRRRYCGAACSRTALMARQRRTEPETSLRICAGCGKPFSPSRARRRYCSDACRSAAVRGKGRSDASSAT